MSTQPHDQTRGDSTPFFQDKQAAPLSRNEVASLCMKAARGAGMSWGMAEEAGFAAAWLAMHGIDGPGYLCTHLKQAQGREWAELCPSVARGDWRAAGGRALCPIVLGATLCDYAALSDGPVADCSITLGKVDCPILMLPFLANIAQKNGVSITVSWAGGSVVVGQGSDWPETASGALAALPSEAELSLTAQQGVATDPPAGQSPKANTGADTISMLNTFAMRTTVPASEQSRAGAGSTLDDND